MMYHYNTELFHFGVLGQKWGIRRFQNPDGTLTEAGKRHYSKDTHKADIIYEVRHPERMLGVEAHRQYKINQYQSEIEEIKDTSYADNRDDYEEYVNDRFMYITGYRPDEMGVDYKTAAKQVETADVNELEAKIFAYSHASYRSIHQSFRLESIKPSVDEFVLEYMPTYIDEALPDKIGTLGMKWKNGRTE